MKKYGICFNRFRIFLFFILIHAMDLLARAGGGGSSPSSSSSSGSGSSSSSYSGSRSSSGGSGGPFDLFSGSVFFLVLLVLWGLPVALYIKYKKAYFASRAMRGDKPDYTLNEKKLIRYSNVYRNFFWIALTLAIVYSLKLFGISGYLPYSINIIIDVFPYILFIIVVYGNLILGFYLVFLLFGLYANSASGGINSGKENSNFGIAGLMGDLMRQGTGFSIPDAGDSVSGDYKTVVTIGKKEVAPEVIAGFDENDLLEKAKTAFFEIQNGWSGKNLSNVRRFISDGVYQRFQTQIAMMNLLEQTNKLDNVRILSISTSNVRSEGKFDVADTRIVASMDDFLVCNLDPKLNSRMNVTFTETWSFLRKHGSGGNSLYHDRNCPSCGAPLGDMGEAAICSTCNTVVNSGEFDWVLSEITQTESDGIENFMDLLMNTNVMQTGVSRDFDHILKKDSGLSIQEIEDKVSNGYLQILSAQVFQNPDQMKRFVDKELFETLCAKIPEKQIAYNRLYLDKVTVTGIQESDGYYIARVRVIECHQRVEPGTNVFGKSRIKLLDDDVVAVERIVSVKRKILSKNKGSLYASICPSCGGRLEDTTAVKCKYCGSVLNSPDHEWIIFDLS